MIGILNIALFFASSCIFIMWQATFLMLKEDVPRGVGSLILPASGKLIFKASDERQRVSASIYMDKEYEVIDILHKVLLQ